MKTDCWFGWPLVRTEAGLLRPATAAEIVKHKLGFGAVLERDP